MENYRLLTLQIPMDIMSLKNVLCVKVKAKSQKMLKRIGRRKITMSPFNQAWVILKEDAQKPPNPYAESRFAQTGQLPGAFGPPKPEPVKPSLWNRFKQGVSDAGQIFGGQKTAFQAGRENRERVNELKDSNEAAEKQWQMEQNNPLIQGHYEQQEKQKQTDEYNQWLEGQNVPAQGDALLAGVAGQLMADPDAEPADNASIPLPGAAAAQPAPAPAPAGGQQQLPELFPDGV
jgi:hypothetical protein